MASFNQNLLAVAAARDQNDKSLSNLYKAKLDLLKQKPGITAAEISTRLAAIQHTANISKEALQNALKTLHDNTPQKLVENWDAKIPVLLMPLRLETRFMESAGKQELWLRIYPDDIAVQQHEPMLTEKEFAEGKKYWALLFDAIKATEETENLKKNAWETFRNLFGPNRSEWVARQSAPANWNEKETLTKKEDLVFTQLPLLKTTEWTQAPQVKILPDKFVATIFNGPKNWSFEGGLIPDTLMMGHDPTQGEEAFIKTDFAINFAPDFSWISDFDEAVKAGMGMKIELKNEYYADISKRLIEQIAVLGVYLSADPIESGKLLEDLLEDHRYTEGLAIIPQGTPTNNTEDAVSGFIPNEDPQPLGYFDISSTPPFQSDPLCDGNRLAAALGIKTSVIEGIAHDNCRDHAEAVMMNTALFPATIGYYFDTLLEKSVSDKTVALLRTFFQNQVTGAGPLPCIRVGDQPYGILVTSNFPKWERNSSDPELAGLLSHMKNILTFFSSHWEDQSQKVLYVGREKDANNNPLKAEDIFLDIVGLEPSSIKFERREGFLNDLPAIKTASAQLTAFRSEAQANESLVEKQIALLGSTAPASSELFSALLFAPEKKVFIPEKNLVDGLPVSETRPLQKIGDPGKDYLTWLAEVSKTDILEQQIFPGAKAPNFLLYLLGRHSLLLELRRLAVDFLNKNNAQIGRSAFDKTYLNLNGATKRDLTIWEVLHADITKIDPAATGVIRKTGDNFLSQGRGSIKQLKSNFASLSSLPTARLERLLTGHLDCLTYRLDAWQSALFFEPLESSRNDTTAPAKGTYLGAFGYLQSLSPAPKTIVNTALLPESLRPPDGKPVFATDNSGLLQAPSLDHAAAAALLMAGYRTHATPTDSGVFSVNLSSSRMRKADQLLEGIRNGQSLESLLGYHFERACHDENLNQFIMAFRVKYPIENQYNKQEGEAVDANVFRTVQPNVVNGLKIAKEKDPNVFKTVISQVIPAGDTVAFTRIIDEVNKLADILDAVKDLLLSESVFQAASGNTARTAAVLESLREGSVPPDPLILKTPRRSRFAFNHVVSIHFPQANADNNPWGVNIPLTPRSQCEPGLNLWLSKILGSPGDLSCSVSHTVEETAVISASKIISLADLKLQPIDFLMYAGNNNSALEKRIAFYYRSLFDLGSEQPVNIDLAGKATLKKSIAETLPLIRSLFSVLTQSRPIHAADYMPFVQGKQNDINKNGYDINELTGRAGACILSLKKVVQKLDNVILNSTAADATNPANLNLLFKEWEGQNFSDALFAGVIINEQKITEITQLRIAIADFDIPAAWPIMLPGGTSKSLADFLADTARMWQSAHLQLDNASAVFDKISEIENLEEKAGILSKLIKLLLGGGYAVMPKFHYRNQTEIKQAFADNQQILSYYSGLSGLPAAIIPDDWFHGVSAVRSKINEWEFARSLAEMDNTADLTLSPVQLPYRQKDNWLAVQFPATDETTGGPFGINTDTISCAIVGREAFDTEALQSGLLIDEWSETIPLETETTGIAFNYNQPDSMPPQALLLAIYPGKESNWTWDALLGTVMDTFKRAKMRAVEPKHFEQDQLIHHFLPGVIAPVNIAGANISLDFAVASDEFLKKLPPGIALYEPHLKVNTI